MMPFPQPPRSPKKIGKTARTTLMLLLAGLLLAGPAGAAFGTDSAVIRATPLEPAAPEPPSFAVYQTPEPSRAVLLVVGSLMVMICYRRAWVNMRRSS